MTTDDAGRHAALQRALARIMALRAAEDSIHSTLPRGLNPLDLTIADPLTPGAFPGVGTPGGPPEPPPAIGPSTSSGRGEAAGPSTSSGHGGVGSGRGGVGSGRVDEVTRSEGAEGEPAAPPEPEAEPEAEPEQTLPELLAELDRLIGLAEVKAEIHRQVAVLRVEGLRTKAGLKSPTITRHLVFVGNPGTGKTTVARLVGGIYRALGLLSKGQLVEVDRSELVAGYLGQTAMKTADVVGTAAGGVLFIDEAYSLAGDQYGSEAVDTLVKEMEDRRDDLVLIVAGYPDPMAIFIAQNPGLASRFRTVIEFADYTDEELMQIFSSLAAQADYDLSDGCRERFAELLAETPRGPLFGNGRFARNQLEAAIGRHAWRLRDVAEPTVAQLRQLLAEDLNPAGGPPAAEDPVTGANAASDTEPDSDEREEPSK